VPNTVRNYGAYIMSSNVTALVETNIAKSNADQADAFAAGDVTLDDLSDLELEARISKDSGGSGGYAYC
jgi:hypothetical protein